MTTATKTPIKATWPVSKVQEKAATLAASQCLAAFQVLSKYGEEAIKEYQAAARGFRVAHLKSLGVKTPLELATAMAETEANVFGSQIEVSGDDQSATLTYNSCAMWNAMQKVGNLTPEQQEKMGSGFQSCMQDLAKEFGYKANVEMEGQTCAVKLSK